MRPRFPRRGPPQSFGWLRLPKLDLGSLVAWEHPEGVVYLIEPGADLIQIVAGLPPTPDLAVRADDPS